MNKLVESIIKPFLIEQNEIKKVIAVYPGRFQPFGPHHKAVYDFIKGKSCQLTSKHKISPKN